MDLSTDIPHNLGSDVMSFGGTTYPFADFFNDESQTLVGSSEPPGLAPPVPCSTSDFRVPDISYSVEGPNPSTPDGDNGHSIRPSPGSNPFASPSSPSKPRSSINSQCILECTQVISNLETYILADLKALDLVLGIVKRTIDKLDELVSLQKDSRDSCCTALFGVAMYQVMQLLEAGCVGLTDSNESTIQGMGDGSQAMAGSYMPVFGLGTFQMDPEEQRAWRAQFVVKELQHSDLILRKMVALSESSQGRDLSKGSEQWYQNVGGRLKALRERIGSGRSSSQIGFG